MPVEASSVPPAVSAAAPSASPGTAHSSAVTGAETGDTRARARGYYQSAFIPNTYYAHCDQGAESKAASGKQHLAQ